MKLSFSHLAVLALVALASTSQAQVQINEIWNGTTTDEYVEFYNASGSSVDVSGWTLVRRTNAATSDGTVYTFPASTSIPAGGFYTIADSGVSGFTADASYTNVISTGNQSIALKNSGGTVIDGLSVGTGSLGVGTLFYAEGTTFPAGISTNSGLARTNNADTNNNSADFAATALATRTPDISNAPATAPEAAVTFASAPVADGAVNVNVGSFTQGTGTQTVTFNVANSGTAALTTTALSVTGTGFSAGADALSGSIATSANDDFTVSIDTTNSGTLNGNISFVNNDGDENPYNFSITADVAAAGAPEVTVSEATAGAQVDGATLNLGNVNVAAGSQTLTFTVGNIGAVDLTTTGTVVSNVIGSAFALGADALATPIAAAGNDTFTVTLDTTVAGAKEATLSFANNDSDENPFNLTLQANLVVPTNTPVFTAFSTTDTVVRVIFSTAPLNGGEITAANYTLGANAGTSVFLVSGTTYEVFFPAATGDLTVDTLTFNNSVDTAANDTFFAGIVPLSTIRAAILADVDATPFAPVITAAGETITVEGIVTSRVLDLDEFRIQDGGFGLGFFDGANNNSLSDFPIPVADGDRSRFAGIISYNNGTAQITAPVYGFNVSVGNPAPAPVVIDSATATAAIYEAAESTLGTVTNVTFATGGTLAPGAAWGASSANVNTNTSPLFLTRRDSDVAFTGNIPTTGPGSVTGLLTQFDSADPRNEAYQVIFLTGNADLNFPSSESDWMILND